MTFKTDIIYHQCVPRPKGNVDPPPRYDNTTENISCIVITMSLRFYVMYLLLTMILPQQYREKHELVM